jgi:hypothetical protein
MTCCQCKKDIVEYEQRILLSCDGDFVCSKKCERDFRKEADSLCVMSNNQFTSWMIGE